jgi:hypothetical protein
VLPALSSTTCVLYLQIKAAGMNRCHRRGLLLLPASLQHMLMQLLSSRPEAACSAKKTMAASSGGLGRLHHWAEPCVASEDSQMFWVRAHFLKATKRQPHSCVPAQPEGHPIMTGQ